MIIRKPSFWEKCATCEFWDGERKASRFGDMVEYKSEEDTGICNKGGSKGEIRNVMDSCNEWKRWRSLGDVPK